MMVALKNGEIEASDILKAEDRINRGQETQDEIFERLQKHRKTSPAVIHKRENRSIFIE